MTYVAQLNLTLNAPAQTLTLTTQGLQGTPGVFQSILGTTNQVNVAISGTGGSVATLSLPQSIATSSSPTFAGLTITGTVAAALFSGSGASLTNTINSVVGTTGQVNVFTSGTTATLSLPQSIATSSSPTFSQLVLTNSPTTSTQVATKGYVDTLTFVTGKLLSSFANTQANNSSYDNGPGIQAALNSLNGTGAPLLIDNTYYVATGVTTNGDNRIFGYNSHGISQLIANANIRLITLNNGNTQSARIVQGLKIDANTANTSLTNSNLVVFTLGTSATQNYTQEIDDVYVVGNKFYRIVEGTNENDMTRLSRITHFGVTGNAFIYINGNASEAAPGAAIEIVDCTSAHQSNSSFGGLNTYGIYVQGVEDCVIRNTIINGHDVDFNVDSQSGVGGNRTTFNVKIENCHSEDFRTFVQDFPTWVASTAYAVSSSSRVTPTIQNGYVYIPTVAGTSGTTQPTWPTTIGATVTDGTVTWQNQGYNGMRWTASTTVATGLVNKPTAINANGWIFQASTGGTTGTTEPTWPTGYGSTVTDGTVTWTAVNQSVNFFLDSANYSSTSVSIENSVFGLGLVTYMQNGGLLNIEGTNSINTGYSHSDYSYKWTGTTSTGYFSAKDTLLNGNFKPYVTSISDTYISKTMVEHCYVTNDSIGYLPSGRTHIHYNDQLKITDTTASTSTSTGSLTTGGGLGVGGSMYVAGSATINSTLSVLGTQVSITNVGNPQIVLKSTTNNQQYNFGYNPTNGNFNIYDATVGGSATRLAIADTTGVVSIPTNTASTSTTTGSLVVAGGVGVAGTINAAALTLTGAMAFSNAAAVAAAGTSQGTATVLTLDTSVVTSGTGGVVLPTGVGREITVINRSGAAINVYPASGASIDGAAANVPTSVPNLGWLTVDVSSATQYFAIDPVTVGGAGISITQSNNGTLTITNTGATSIVAGTDISVSGATGAVTVNDTSTLATVTGRGASTSTALTVTNTVTANSFVPTSSTAPSNGLFLSSTNQVALSAGSATQLQVNSSAVVAGTGTYNPVAHSLTTSSGTTFANSSIISQTYPSIGFNAYYDTTNLAWTTTQTSTYGFYIRSDNAGNLVVYSTGNTGTIGNSVATTSSAIAEFVTGSSTSSTGGFSILRTTASTSTTTGALTVAGGVGVAGTVYAAGFNGPLTGNASTATSATSATTATNIAGGAADSLVYQTGVGATGFIAAGTAGQVLTMVSGVPTWSTSSSTNATNLSGGSADSIPYQTAASTTGFIAAGTNGQVLTMVSGAPAWANNTGGVTSLANTDGNITVSASTGAITINLATNLTVGNIFGAATTSAYTIAANPSGSFSSGGYIQVYGSGASPAAEVIIGAASTTAQTITSAGTTFAGTVTLPGGGTLVTQSGGSGTAYGNINVGGTNAGGWAGIGFNSSYNHQTFMVSTSSDSSGVYDPVGGVWQWRFDGTALAAGTVPGSLVTGTVSSATTAGACSGNSATVTCYGGRTDGTAYPVLWANPGGTTSSQPTYACNNVTITSSTGTLNATILNATSDVNKKTNIKVIEHAPEIIASLNGVRFNWKDNGTASAGLIAQDVEKVLPELVTTGDDGTKSLNYNGVIGALVEAVKSLQAEVAALKASL